MNQQLTHGQTYSLLRLTAVLDDTCLLLLWDYDKTWSISLTELWMSDWWWDSDLKRLCSRCLLVDQGPGLWPLSSGLHIPADTHKRRGLSEKYHPNCANSRRHKSLTFPRFQSVFSSCFYFHLFPNTAAVLIRLTQYDSGKKRCLIHWAFVAFVPQSDMMLLKKNPVLQRDIVRPFILSNFLPLLHTLTPFPQHTHTCTLRRAHQLPPIDPVNCV